MIYCRFIIKTFFLLLWTVFTVSTSAQNLNRVRIGDYERTIERKVWHIPDLEGYMTLKADLHIHTVFSDGRVWPEFRVQEAWKEGLDVMAITDHIEYRPYWENVTGDHNTPYEITRSVAERQNIILIRGAEITRRMPPGHLNALFLDDVNALAQDDVMAAIEAAAGQGAFIMWNHPASQWGDTAKWWDMHTEILEKGWLHGVEVANAGEWYPLAIDWCRDTNLTAIASSDIHRPVDYKYDLSLPHSHRPMTLVFSKDRTEEGVKEALFAGRTVGFTGHLLLGHEEWIIQLFDASVQIHPPFHILERDGHKIIYREMENPTDLTFILEKKGDGSHPGRIELRPHSIKIISYLEGEAELHYHLVNCWSGSTVHPLVILEH